MSTAGDIYREFNAPINVRLDKLTEKYGISEVMTFLDKIKIRGSKYKFIFFPEKNLECRLTVKRRFPLSAVSIRRWKEKGSSGIMIGTSDHPSNFEDNGIELQGKILAYVDRIDNVMEAKRYIIN